MQKIGEKYVEAFCPNCQVVKPYEEMKCSKCGSMVPICHSEDPTAVVNHLNRIFSSPRYFMGTNPEPKKSIADEMLKGLTEFAEALESREVSFKKD
jgi:hypothetical protein